MEKIEEEIKKCKKDIENIKKEIAKIFIGQQAIVNSCIKAVLCTH